MNANNHTIQVPPPEQIRERLAATVAEALRPCGKLLRLAEAAVRTEEARSRSCQLVPAKEGQCNE